MKKIYVNPVLKIHALEVSEFLATDPFLADLSMGSWVLEGEDEPEEEE